VNIIEIASRDGQEISTKVGKDINEKKSNGGIWYET